MARGKRFDDNEVKKLNMKKVVGVLLAIIVVVLIVVTVNTILRR